MKRISKLGYCALALLLAVGMTACCPCRKSRPLPSLNGTAWRMIQIEGKDLVTRPEPSSYTLRFGSDGRFTGVGSCNRLSGTYSQGTDGLLKLDPATSTMMACPQAEGETAFKQLLPEVSHYRIDGQLLLLFSDKELRAVFETVE